MIERKTIAPSLISDERRLLLHVQPYQLCVSMPEKRSATQHFPHVQSYQLCVPMPEEGSATQHFPHPHICKCSALLLSPPPHISVLTMSIPAPVQAAIQGIIEDARACRGSVCTHRDNAMKLLEECGMVYRQTVHCQHVLCHPENRFGDGLEPSRCHKLMRDIASVGFSFSMVDAVAFEIPASDIGRAKVEAFNQSMAVSSDGLLASVRPGTAQLATVCGGHLTGGLRAIHFGQKSLPECSAICDGGFLASHAIPQRDQEFAKALREGLEYRIIRHQAEELFPGLPDLFQEVGNIGGQLFHGEGTTSLLLKIHSRGARMQEATGSIDWQLVEQLVLRSCPPNPSDVPAMCKYVEFWSGGAAIPILLHDLQEFTRGLPCARTLRGPLFNALHELNVGAGKGGRLRTAVLKAASCAAEKHCSSHGEATKLCTPADIASMKIGGRNHAPAMQADAMMQQARSLVNVELSNRLGNALNLMLSHFDVDLVLFVFKKLPRDRGVERMADLGTRLYAKLSEHGSLPPNPWASHGTKPTKGSVPSSSGSCLAEMDDQAQVTDYTSMLTNAGFVSGAIIEREGHAMRFQIVSHTATHVDLQACESSKNPRIQILASEALTNYQLSRPAAKVLQGQELARVRPCESKEMRWELVLSAVRFALFKLDQEMDVDVAVTVSPSSARKVVASTSFPKGKALFVPSSVRLMKFDAKKCTPTTVMIDIKRGAEAAERVVVQPQQVLQPKGEQDMVVAAFWMVSSTPYQAAVNCVMDNLEHVFGAYTLSIPVIMAKRKITAGEEPG